MTSPEYTGCDDLREWLVSQGFTICTDHIHINRGCNWYACRKTTLEARECETNEGKPMQLVANPYQVWDHQLGQYWRSVEVDVTGEAGGVWYTLKAYSLRPKELRERLPEIERRLIAAWNAL